MSYASEVLADSPRAWYRMNEASGLPQDSSGNGNHADEVAGTPVYNQTGPITNDGAAKAITLGGSAYFGIPDAVSLDLGQLFTLEGWVKRGVTGVEGAILVKYSGYGIFIDSGNHLAYGWSNVGYIVVSTTTITDTTTWHHLVATKNGTTSHLYIDNVDRTGTVTDLTIADNANKLYIGSESTATIINATVAELAVYPTELSAARVSAHYTAATAAAAAGRYLDVPLLGAG